jgi:hypothetical protein
MISKPILDNRFCLLYLIARHFRSELLPHAHGKRPWRTLELRARGRGRAEFFRCSLAAAASHDRTRHGRDMVENQT